MKQFIKRVSITTAIILLFILGGCAGRQVMPSPVPSTATPGESAYPAPSLGPEAEKELYKHDYEDLRKQLTRFFEKTTADLDGDGKEDTIELAPLPEDMSKANEDRNEFSRISVTINSIPTTAEAPTARMFSEYGTNLEWKLSAFIIDLNENDGKKEILLEDSFENWPASCIITYDGKTVKQSKWMYAVYANGKGYITCFEKLSKVRLAMPDGMPIYRIKQYDPTSGTLKNADVERYWTYYSSTPASLPGAKTAWDEYLCKAPGEADDLFTPSGTEIYFGYYDPMGWMEVNTRDGRTLGWLDCRKVHWFAYMDYASWPSMGYGPDDTEEEAVEPSASPGPTMPPSYFSTTDELTPEAEMALFNFEDGEYEQYNKLVVNKTTADMDGDGKDETVELLPGKLSEGVTTEEEIKNYDTIIVKIGGKQIKVKKGFYEYQYEDGTRGPYGYLIDLDKNDGRKEIMLEDDFEDWPMYSIIIYDGKSIKQLPWMHGLAADGSGYVTASEWVEGRKLAGDQGMVVERIKKYVPDEGKLANIKAKYCRTWYSIFPPVDSSVDPSYSAWDQYLATEPGGKEDVLVKRSTEIFYGWYHDEGWLEVHTRDGKTLGWLNCNKVDWMDYNRWANDPFAGW